MTRLVLRLSKVLIRSSQLPNVLTLNIIGNWREGNKLSELLETPKAIRYYISSDNPEDDPSPSDDEMDNQHPMY